MAWHQTPQARAILASLSPHDLRITTHQPIVGSDRLIWAPATDHGDACWTLLNGLRTHAIDCAAGTTFAKALAAYHVDPVPAYSYLAIAERTPDVRDVLCDRFGNPEQWHGHGAAMAQAMWVNDAGALMPVQMAEAA